MCEIFGVSSKKVCQLNEYLSEFYSHSNAHPHGWGLACMEGVEVSIEKEPIQASKSKYLKERLGVPILASTAFAHIRYATIGNVEYKNCHPYTWKSRSGRRWTLVHNGTVFDYPRLNEYVHIQHGDTDSERILLYIVACMDQAEAKLGREPDARERFQILDNIFVDMSKGNKLNILIFDGELFYVHTNYVNTLFKLEHDDQTLFSTQPLSREEWIPIEFNTLLAYQEGKEVFRGTDHGNEYIENEENLKFLYQVFAGL